MSEYRQSRILPLLISLYPEKRPFQRPKSAITKIGCESGMELQDHGIRDQKIVNQSILKIHQETGIPMVCNSR